MTVEKSHSRRTQGPSINANGTLPLKLNEAQNTITLDLISTSSLHLWDNLTHDIALKGTNGRGAPVTVKPTLDASKRYVVFPLDKTLDQSKPLQVTVNGKPVAEFRWQDNRLIETEKHGLYQLAIHETRNMSNANLNPPDLLPYDRSRREGYKDELHAPITDLHTHVSTQVSASDLYELSLALDKKADSPKHYVTYPVELLEKLKVPALPNQQLVDVDAYEFKPLQYEKLLCERGQPSDPKAPRNQYKAIRLSDMTERQRIAVISAMDAPQDGTKSFQQVEEDIYRHTSPLTRNPSLTKPLLRRIAENYAAQGIQHAELATSSLLNPQWFKAMVEAVDEIEHGTRNPDGTRNNDAITVGPDKKPFTMRFLIGLPRNSGPTATMEALERTKFLAQHPYIYGVDLMGSETNKTSDFHWALSHMAMWARKSENTKLNPNDGWNFKEDFIIRVHAGESAKNPRNVADAIEIAHEHKVRVRVGHAQNADLLDEDERKLAYMKTNEGRKDAKTQEQNPNDWFAFEKCSDSNVFYRMKSLADEVVIKPHSDMAHCVLGQDGNGLAHTSPRQCAFGAIAAGLSLDELAAMRTYEETYIQHCRARDVRKTKAFEKSYPDFSRFADAYSKFDPKTVISKRFEGKIPILIGGASDNSWKKLAKMDQKSVEHMMEVLVQSFNPEEMYFVLGRVESEGVNKALDRAIKNYNLAHPSNKFNVMARFGHAVAEAPTGELAETISGFESIPGGINVVPDSQIKYIRERGGKALFFDGAQFTAAMLTDTMDEKRGEVPCAAFVTAANAVLQSVMRIFDPKKRIASSADLLKRILRDVGPDCFFKDSDERDRLLSPNLTITDDFSCDQLLDDAEKQARHLQTNRLRVSEGRYPHPVRAARTK